MDEVTHRVLCIWRLLGLAVKGPWLAMGTPILTLATCINSLRKDYSHLVGDSFMAGKGAWVLVGVC